MALFITFEGGEGSGKSLQARVLYRRLSRLGIPALLTHEPGATSLGRKVARWLKWGRDMEISAIAELLLFNVSRAQLVTEVIRPGLKEGRVVICDRYADSTTAYQSYGRGLDLTTVRVINGLAVQGVSPDLTVLLDIPVEVGLARKRARQPDRFEREDTSFHQRVREGYLELAAQDEERWLVVDATQPKEKIAQIIWQKVSELLPRAKEGA
ncbi:MAG TPA: dTMP kinase [Dehalococcoidia bacterium]|jgi:dTMP kinase|nr:dTMP kinase [Dehalococcoidia bacterium]